MKLILLTMMLSLAAAIELHPEETHDHETLPHDLENIRMRVQCALEIIPCDEVNKSYLEQIPKSLERACANCTPEAKKFLHAAITTVKLNFPEEYDVLVKKYDPEGKHLDKLIEVVSAA